MSGEFGDDGYGGFFHNKIDNAAGNASDGRLEITKLWGAFLRDFVPIARAISWEEACDSGPGEAIGVTLDRMRVLRDRLDDIERFVAPYRAIRDKAVRDAEMARGTGTAIKIRDLITKEERGIVARIVRGHERVEGSDIVRYAEGSGHVLGADSMFVADQKDAQSVARYYSTTSRGPVEVWRPIAVKDAT